jgi:PAS domain-containing protein
MSDTITRSDTRGRRMPQRSDKAVPRSGAVPEDRFFRQIVRSMRNGVIAFKRDGTLALMNDEAYRIFGLTKNDADVGRAFADA